MKKVTLHYPIKQDEIENFIKINFLDKKGIDSRMTVWIKEEDNIFVKLIENITVDEFCEGFSQVAANNFSEGAKKALYKSMKDYEESHNHEYRLDYEQYRKIHDNYSEYPSLKAIQEKFPEIKTFDDILKRTKVYPVYINGKDDSAGMLTKRIKFEEEE